MYLAYRPLTMRALEGLQVVGEEKDILKEIRHGMDAEDQEEVVVKAVKELKNLWPDPSGLLSGPWKTAYYIIEARSMFLELISVAEF